VNVEELPEMDFAPREHDRYLLRPGDLLVCEGGEVGRTAIWRGELDECFYQKAIHRVRPRSADDEPRFLYYLMYVAAKRGVFTAGGNPNTIDHLTAIQLRHYRFSFPPAAEQRAIAAFLDRETAKIDGLVARKERLIELLQEKRTALITRAVTRGLDPNVPMKDSGAEWLGEIPAHWEVVPSTWIFTESKQRARDGDEQLSATQKYGVIPQAEFERLEGRQVVHAFMHLHQRKHVDVDDFVMSMRSFQGGLERVWVRGCVRSSYGVLRASSNVHVGFFSHLFKSSAYIQALRATSNFIRDGQDLNFHNFRLVKLPSVPAREQKAIAAFLDQETARIDALIAKIREAIDHLKEFRTALISAAVTGKIDVREEVS
jgi:type I restriction enzyme S subunit